jgi:hypothetical protein
VELMLRVKENEGVIEKRLCAGSDTAFSVNKGRHSYVLASQSSLPLEFCQSNKRDLNQTWWSFWCLPASFPYRIGKVPFVSQGSNSLLLCALMLQRCSHVASFVGCVVVFVNYRRVAAYRAVRGSHLARMVLFRQQFHGWSFADLLLATTIVQAALAQ